MAKAGDSYIVTLREAHLGWGCYRHTDTIIIAFSVPSAYLHIPASYARNYEIYNANFTGNRDVLGENIFNCRSVDGFLEWRMKAQGCRTAGDCFAKQFSVDDNLRALGAWYKHVGATVGDRVRVTWTSEYDMVIEKL